LRRSMNQYGQALQRVLIGSAAGIFVLGLIAGVAHIALPVAAVLALAGWAFSSLTVEVSPDELT
jgi:DMSO reductase anchor subunit